MRLKREHIGTMLRTKFLSLLDIHYKQTKHYFSVTRRNVEDIIAIKTDKEFQESFPDAVSCFVVIRTPDGPPRLLLSYEYRYPAGRFLLSVPAGLIDKEDDRKDVIIQTAIREIKEETGLRVKDTDSVNIINPFVFSSPGITDESNALVCVVMDMNNEPKLTRKGAKGSELFDEFELVTPAAAVELLNNGRDKNGNFYPVYTWAALSYFCDNWEQYQTD